jgi:DNA polymerase-3 subunit epsilon
MIHQLLTLTRPLIVFDCETTGVDTNTDRIVELGFQLWTADGLQKEWRSLVNPCVPIPAGATAVHHITDAMVNACKDCGRP